ncbi:MAG: DUF2269 family protein [Candidatus Eisenbacteria bacterium]|nr:DUF2269 family protein [Candidatus Eisenbacteria bacterium]
MLSVFRIVHVLSALLFFGGLLPVTFLFGMVMRQTDASARLAGLRLLGAANRAFLLPGSILSGLSGFALSGMKPVSIGGTPWLMAAVVLYVIAFVLSMAVLAPHSRRLVQAAAAALKSGSGVEVDALARRPLPRAARAIVGVAGLAIAVLMTWRP